MSDGMQPSRTVLQRPSTSRKSTETPSTSTQPAGPARLNSSSSGDKSSKPTSALDLSEFPSLTSRSGNVAPSFVALPPGPKPYVGIVKLATSSEHTEFTMSSEDFPALPGPSKAGNNASLETGTTGSEAAAGGVGREQKINGIQTSPDGTISGIPPSMIPNQFGMVGLLRLIRTAETDPNMVSLTLGQDLTSLGLDLNSSDNLYLNFGGPLAGNSCRPQDIDYHVPPEYKMNGSVREKIAPLHLNRYKEDLLFYLFYTFIGDRLQIAAAMELYDRDWRYHMEEKVWISQAPGMPILEKTSLYERGTYFFFDPYNWRRMPKEFRLEYCKLEGRPQFPRM